MSLSDKILSASRLSIALILLSLVNPIWAGDGFIIEEAVWDGERSRLKVKGKGDNKRTVTVTSAASGRLIGTSRVRDRKWRVRETVRATVPCRVRAEQSDGQVVEANVKEAPDDCEGAVTPPPPPPPLAGDYTVLAANDLGMHCADLDYRIFSILPPYNVINAQVLRKGREPELMSPVDGVELSYRAAISNIIDANDPTAAPLATDSLNSTSENDLAAGVFKGNFWDPENNPGDPLLGFLAYDNLYPPGLLASFPLRDALANFLLGLPAPDIEEFWLGSGALTAEQSTMPGKNAPFAANDPQPFHGFVETLPFFVSLPFGYEVTDFKRFTAEGVPITPIDDAGRLNPYPLMSVEARDAAGNLLASNEIVLPVASEADCQSCHLEQEVCTDLSLGFNCGDVANFYDRGAEYITLSNIDTTNPANPNHVPGDTAEQVAINAAKINILRLHDAKNDTSLDSERSIVCANCHYSPALDLAHLGPNDDNGKQQTQHKSMSNVMHSYHAGLPANDANDPNGVFDDLFPVMPTFDQRTAEQTQELLENTCYSCHPGKRTACLRGAMSDGGMVCQDCHGQGTQVGNDFSHQFPDVAGSADLSKRVPWASEPKCQSCHIGDVLQVEQLAASGALDQLLMNTSDTWDNQDGLRTRMAYSLPEHVANGGDQDLQLLDFSDSRFASEQALYRLSGSGDKGHGGLFCEGCHGSTHAIWPNANPFSNDNKAANDLQGHTGPIIECSSCHTGDLGTTLEGPHGMHPVGASRFAEDHEDLAEDNPNACRACHGKNGEGSVLSRAATDRVLETKEDEYGGGTLHVSRGTPITCTMCHENEL